MKNVLIVCALVLLGYMAAQFNFTGANTSVEADSRPKAEPVVNAAVMPSPESEPEIPNREATNDAMPEVSQDLTDPLVADFVATGNPRQVMDFFKQRRAARAELLQRRMSQENSDDRWSRELQDQYTNAKTLLPGMNRLDLNSADCRESICALEFAYTGNTQYKDVQPLMSNIGNVLGADAFVHYDALPDAAVIYVSRGEERLPDLENSADG